MGALCSTEDKGATVLDEAEAESKSGRTGHSHITKMPPSSYTNRVTRGKMKGGNALSSIEAYDEARSAILAREKAQAFDGDAQKNATALERRAAQIVKEIKKSDAQIVYADTKDENGIQRVPADHFLGNVSIINKTELFRIAQEMPKGAHLHCHFNSCLPPHFLISQARDVKAMWIKSTISLSTEQGMKDAEIAFQVQEPPQVQNARVPAPAVLVREGDLFDAKYEGGAWMRYSEFLTACGGYEIAERWLVSKMLLSEDEVHHIGQSGKKIWERFDVCTRMMKGLFNYEKAFRNYTKACIEDFAKDKIQYAEIRPNFPSNKLYHDNGIGYFENAGMMKIIVEEIASQRVKTPYFCGLRVIYCCPRSFNNAQVRQSLQECIDLKKKFPDLICGYDLVGSEDRGRPLRDFISDFIWFKEECRNEDLDIPFLFHAGETLDTGTPTDQNLIDAALLGSKRIGHGFALPKHPEAMKMVKEKNICLEICPISNEILHLTPTIRGHTLPILLANNIHCSVNSDNGTFYSSTLSHDFYQTMIGSESMDILGWSVLAKWSLEHSCMPTAEYRETLKLWKAEWTKFCEWVVATYGERFPEENVVL